MAGEADSVGVSELLEYARECIEHPSDSFGITRLLKAVLVVVAIAPVSVTQCHSATFNTAQRHSMRFKAVQCPSSR